MNGTTVPLLAGGCTGDILTIGGVFSFLADVIPSNANFGGGSAL